MSTFYMYIFNVINLTDVDSLAKTVQKPSSSFDALLKVPPVSWLGTLYHNVPLGSRASSSYLLTNLKNLDLTF